MLWGIKLAGNRVWNYTNRRVVGTRHATWSWKNVYGSRVISCYGTLLFDLQWCILFISIFIILTNVDTLITLCFCVCRWNMKKKKTVNAINKTFVQITQVIEVARALTTIPTKNDDHYIWISMQAILWNNCLWKSNILFNVMDIVSQLKDKGIRIIVPFCMIKSVFYIYIYIYI